MENIKKIISPSRFSTFSKRGRDDHEALNYYLWDISLCQSLYPCLHILEITLRNTIHNSAIKQYNRNDWYDLIIHNQDKARLDKVKKSFKNRPLPDDIIAALTFGFWTTLFNKRYQNFARPILKNAFPYMPKKIRSPETIRKRLNNIRRLRNRVFHYEPMYNNTKLKTRHDEIVEVIGWIEPEMEKLNLKLDTFDVVYSAQPQK